MVQAIFFTGKDSMIVGLKIQSGKAENKSQITVVRNGSRVGSGKIESLKLGVESIHKVESGKECGISFAGDVKLLVGDVLEFSKMMERK